MEPSSPLRKLPFMGPTKPQIGTNDAFRFQIGVNFKAKIIGIEKVPEARGDRMCQEVIQKQKAYVKAIGKHKQPIIVNVSLEGIKLVDLVTQETLHQHPVQRISFISRDVSDARAFGYIYGPGDGTHHFFGLKTEKAAENLVLTLRDLFQVVFEMKKKEAEEEKKKKIDLTGGSDTTQNKPTEKPQSAKTARRFKYVRQVTTEESQESVQKEEGGGLLDLEGLGLGGMEQSQPNAVFDPMSGGGSAVTASGDPFNTNQSSQNQFPFGGSDPFAATQQAQPTFNTPAPTQSAWATFPQTPVGGAFPPPSNQPTNQNVAFGGPMTAPVNQGAAFGTAASPFQNDPFGAGGQNIAAQGRMPTNWGQMQNNSNPFNTASTDVFGAGSSAAINGSSVNSGFSNSPLSPTSVQVNQSGPAQQPPTRQDMFAGLVDSFGVDFGAKKEQTPPPKMNQLAGQTQVNESSGDESNQTFATSCPLATEEEDPFVVNTVNRPISVNEMEMAPNVFTKTVSFSESESDITPDRDVPAPSLPPPPLPSNVNKQIFSNDYAPTPPPRPLNRQISATTKSSSNTQGSVGLYSNVPGDHTHEQPQQQTDVKKTPPGITRGVTVDLGNFLESPPPPPPPRPGSRGTTKQLLYCSLPRPHASSKAPLSPPVIQAFKQSPCNSPTLSRNRTLSNNSTNSPTSSPQLQRQTTLPTVSNGVLDKSHFHRNNSGNSNDIFVSRSPHLNREHSGNSNDFVPNSPPLKRYNSGNSSIPGTPPVVRHEIQSSTPRVENQQFEANFANFANFQASEKDFHEETPPPPPPRPGSGKKKTPMLSSTSRSMTLPASSHSVDSDRSNTPDADQRNVSETIKEQEEFQTSDTVDPFAVAIGKSHKGKNMNSAYARPRPRPRSKTPTLISTKTSLSMAVRSDSPHNQNNGSNKEFEGFDAFTTSKQNKPDFDGSSHHSGSPRETRHLSGKDSYHVNHQRTGTPVSIHSMQSASSGHSGEQVVDPFAHVDPFETNKESQDPFGEKDPFANSDPFKSPTDPFSKDLNDAEFKTKAIAITADGLEVEESVSSNNNVVTDIKVDPDPFASDPFSLIKDPFDKSKSGLGQPLIRSHSKVDDQTVDPFDTAYAADTLNKTAFTPEFSNTFESGIVGHSTNVSDMFKELAQTDISSSSESKSAVDNHRDTWTANFDNSPNVNHVQKNDFPKSNQYYVNPTSHVADNFNQSELRSHQENCNFNQSHFSNLPRDSPSNQISNEQIMYHRERHESDSTSYNSEISEAFASNVPTPSSLPPQQINGRGTPGNPFLTTNTQNPSANQPATTGGGSLLDF